MIYIANPIYDSVFKYMMEDAKAARLLLSRLLKKEVVSLDVRRNEYSNVRQKEVSIFRIDFAATVREKDGSTRLVIIELQKTWKPTETLRFRQYLGVQYENRENILPDDSRYGLPIVSIYLLGHKVGNVQEPVVYVKRQYLDYDDHEITQGVPDKFIESLTHDSIIVQIPYLEQHARNHLEQLLAVFDQKLEQQSNGHVLVFDDSQSDDPELQYLLQCLTRAGMDPEVRQKMNVEDEILSEVEKLDTELKQTKAALQEKDSALQAALNLLRSQGMSEADIQKMLGL